jgi:hypothetical protein
LFRNSNNWWFENTNESNTGKNKLEKNEVAQKYLKHMRINSIFDAGSKYDIGFDIS